MDGREWYVLLLEDRDLKFREFILYLNYSSLILTSCENRTVDLNQWLFSGM